MFHVKHPRKTDREKHAMRSIFRRAAAAITIITAPALIVACTATPQASGRPTANRTTIVAPSPTIFEDNPNWDCLAMDNELCNDAIDEACFGLTGAELHACVVLAARKTTTSRPQADGSYATGDTGIPLIEECREQREARVLDVSLIACFQRSGASLS